MARLTASAFTCSHKFESSLMKEILVATNAVADSRTSSAVSWLVTMTGTPRITRGWRICFSAITASFALVPRDNSVRPVKIFHRAARSKKHRLRHDGRLQAGVLQPLFNAGSGFRPTTGVMMERMGGLGAKRAIRTARSAGAVAYPRPEKFTWAFRAKGLHVRWSRPSGRSARYA